MIPIVFFEGLDKTGKSTLARRCRFEAVPAHPCLMVDRGFVGREMFVKYHKEEAFDFSLWASLEETLFLNRALKVVWLMSSPEIIRRRHREAGEEPPSFKTIEEQIEIYKELFTKRVTAGHDILVLSTDILSEDQCVKKVLWWLEYGWRKP